MTMGRQLNSRPPISIDTTWRTHAKCRFENLDMFFPAGTTGAAVEEMEAAKAICKGCQVRDRCLRFALETNQEDGIWGGTTEAERRKLRRAWLAARRAPAAAHTRQSQVSA
jgi:WhiB family redox-sensing transcriptional regulator